MQMANQNTPTHIQCLDILVDPGLRRDDDFEGVIMSVVNSATLL